MRNIISWLGQMRLNDRFAPLADIPSLARDKIPKWNCNRVIVAHGDWPRTNGNVFLEKSFQWLGT